MEHITYYGETDGISLEQMTRQGKFDMRVKHFHTQYEIFYIMEGQRVFFFNNREYLAGAGDLILIDSNLIHMTKSIAGSDKGHSRTILYISREKLASYDALFPSLRLASFFHEYYGVYRLDSDHQAAILALFDRIRNALTARGHNYRTGIDLSLLSWLFRLMEYVRRNRQEPPSESDSPKHKIACEIAEYLSENCCRPISLDDLAGHFFLSRSYICRVFKEVTGYTVREYANIHRIRKARRLLEETDLPVSQIADNLGYESLTYFERIFKQYMDVSPLKYRKTLNTLTGPTEPSSDDSIALPKE